MSEHRLRGGDAVEGADGAHADALQNETAERRRIQAVLEQRLSLEQLLARVSTRFINLKLEESDAAIVDALRSIAETLGADRGCIVRLEPSGARRVHQWAGPAGSSLELSPRALPWIFAGLQRCETVYVDRLGDLPLEARDDREYLRAAGVKSLLALPMVSSGSLDGVVCFEAVQRTWSWRSDLVGLLRIVGEIFASTLDRQRAEAALRHSEHWLRTVAANTPVVLFALDREGIITHSEGKGLESLRLGASEAVGRSAYELYKSPEVHENVRRALGGESFSATVKVGRRYYETWHAPIFEAGVVSGMIGVATDVTARKLAEEAHQITEERLALAMDGAMDGLWDWDTRTQSIYYSSRWKGMLGFKNGELSADPEEWFSRIHPDDVDRVRGDLDRHLANATPHFEAEYRAAHKDGTWRWMLSRGVALRDAAGQSYRMAGSQSDITSRKLTEERILHDALHDPLTGLPNRNLFVQRLAGALARAEAEHAFAVLFLDLDRFKLVNYGLGHQFGDRLLVEVGHRLVACLRPGDAVARLGGDEFTVLLEGLQDDLDIGAICERFQAALRDVHSLDGHEIFTSASIGVALGDLRYRSPEEVMRDADTAMFHAKGLGRGRYVVYDRRMQDEAVAQLRLENDLRRAVERMEFNIRYQPIVALHDGSISGFEALVRWEHPTRGVVRPEEFISVAEETGLIIPIGRWMLSEACRQTVVWRNRFPELPALGMSVNVSSREFARPDLLPAIKQVLEETGLAGSALRLEITETLIMENSDSVLTMLEDLKRLGVQLSIDDFGTGYSSLSRLHRFPLDAFKIDQSFVQRIGVDDGYPEIVRTIVTLATNLGMDVIAEGIETAVQASELRKLGCGWGQGYFFARPIDEVAATELLASGKRFAID